MPRLPEDPNPKLRIVIRELLLPTNPGKFAGGEPAEPKRDALG
jgi:hypothetical protein